MIKVFLVHGYRGWPNGGWRVWLMDELEKKEIYACALPMSSPNQPILGEWIQEIAKQIDINNDDEIYLVGHSLGSTAILRYLESDSAKKIAGAVLASGPIEKVENKDISNFLEKEFNFKTIKSKSGKFCIIHGDNDPRVPLSNAERLSKELDCELVVVKDGGHLNGSSGWDSLPQALDALNKMFKA